MHRGPPIIGLVIALVLYVGLHLYMWARLVRSTELPARWRRAAAIVLVVAAIYMPLAMLLGRALGLSLPPALAWPGALWAGVGLYLILSLVAADVLRWLVELGLWLRHRELLQQPTTQRKLYRGSGAAAALVALTMSTLGALGAACGPSVHRVEVPLRRLPAAMDGFRVVQISDLHAGRTIGPSYVAHVAEMVAELEPDLLVLTGDLVDGTVPALAPALEPLLRLRPPHGIVYVTGNHEFYAGAEPWRRHLRSRGVRVLSNQRLRIGTSETSFELAGVEDRQGHSDLEAAMAGRDPRSAVVLLAHRPDVIDAAAMLDVDLQLSGHTHGGQLWPFTWMVHHATPYPSGLHRHQDSWLYVNPGTGYVGPPMRLGMPSEITELTLRAASTP